MNPVLLFIKYCYIDKTNSDFEFFIRNFTGIFFLYGMLHTSFSRKEFETYLQRKADQFIEGTAWTFEYAFIRQSKEYIVYRLQFCVPNEKSFCCGNQCTRCILF